MNAEEDDDLYVAPTVERTVGIKGLKTMFEEKPMPLHTPSGGSAGIKSLQAANAQLGKPIPAAKKPLTTNKVHIPDGLKKELLNKQPLKSVPNLPRKDKRLSIDANGEIKVLKPSEIIAAQKSEKSPIKPPPMVPTTKEKPKLLPKTHIRPRASDNNNDEGSKTAVEDAKQNTFIESTLPQKVSELEFIGEPITDNKGETYRRINCPVKPKNPPLKPRLPKKIDIIDILQQYAPEDDTYDDVIAEDPEPARAVSVISEFTEEEEMQEKTKAQQDEAEKEKYEQEEYDDVAVRVSNVDRKSKTVSMTSTGSDIYETFDEVLSEKF